MKLCEVFSADFIVLEDKTAAEANIEPSLELFHKLLCSVHEGLQNSSVKLKLKIEVRVEDNKHFSIRILS